MTTGNYLSDHREHRHEPVDEAKKQPNRSFIDKELAIKVIMDWWTAAVYTFRKKLGFEQYNVILTKKQAVLTKTKGPFEG